MRLLQETKEQVENIQETKEFLNDSIDVMATTLERADTEAFVMLDYPIKYTEKERKLLWDIRDIYSRFNEWLYGEKMTTENKELMEELEEMGFGYRLLRH